MKDKLTFILFTPECSFMPMECDSIKLSVADSISGKFSGSYGIKKGHARAVFALKSGTVTVAKDGKTVLTANISDGFAIVENNEISITVDRIEE